MVVMVVVAVTKASETAESVQITIIRRVEVVVVTIAITVVPAHDVMTSTTVGITRTQ